MGWFLLGFGLMTEMAAGSQSYAGSGRQKKIVHYPMTFLQLTVQLCQGNMLIYPAIGFYAALYAICFGQSDASIF
jgi:hypothetical protein